MKCGTPSGCIFLSPVLHYQLRRGVPVVTDQRGAPAQGSFDYPSGQSQTPEKRPCMSRVRSGRSLRQDRGLPVGRRISAAPASLGRAERRCSSPGASGAGGCNRSFPGTASHRHRSGRDSSPLSRGMSVCVPVGGRGCRCRCLCRAGGGTAPGPAGRNWAW